MHRIVLTYKVRQVTFARVQSTWVTSFFLLKLIFVRLRIRVTLDHLQRQICRTRRQSPEWKYRAAPRTELLSDSQWRQYPSGDRIGIAKELLKTKFNYFVFTFEIVVLTCRIQSWASLTASSFVTSGWDWRRNSIAVAASSYRSRLFLYM